MPRLLRASLRRLPKRSRITETVASALVARTILLSSSRKACRSSRIARIPEQPKLLSLQGANVAGLGLANVDLTDCRFSGAHNLDKLRLEADVAFKPSPAQVGWEQRQVIAEECTWRASQPRPGRWADAQPWWFDHADSSWPEGLEKPIPLAPGAIAGLYRALRKSREDASDEPDAADFYYGEMEMRRHANGRAAHGDGGSRGRVDRGVLTAYWLVSGYGLRAWRALAWFASITVAFALAFHLVGFTASLACAAAALAARVSRRICAGLARLTGRPQTEDPASVQLTAVPARAADLARGAPGADHLRGPH